MRSVIIVAPELVASFIVTNCCHSNIVVGLWAVLVPWQHAEGCCKAAWSGAVHRAWWLVAVCAVLQLAGYCAADTVP